MLRQIKQPVWCLAAAAMVLSACGGKSDDKKSNNDKPAAVDTWLTGSSVEGGTASFTYKSNMDGVSYKCQMMIDGQAGDWADCPADGYSTAVPAGAKVTFKVKAIAADGREDADPTSYSFTVPGDQGQDPGQGQDPFDGALATSILNKSEIKDGLVTSRSLMLNIGVTGAPVTATEMSFECMRENASDYSPCAANGTYEFTDLVDGSEYSLKVRGRHNPTGVIAQEDMVNFKVQIAKVKIDGADTLAQTKTGQVALSFDLADTGASRIECRVNTNNPVECTYGYQLDLDNLQRGSHTLYVEAKGANNETISSSVVNFCAVSCGEPGQPSQPIIQDFLVGNFYKFRVPEGMHVTEYATTKTFNRQLSFYRVMADSDPYYIGNYACDGLFDRRVTAATPRGNELDYCHSTPTDGLYKWLTDFRLANNHIEVATDADIVQQYPQAHERIMINVFDRDYEFMQTRSRFEMLCLNRRGSIKVSPPIRFMRDFFGEPVHATFMMCDIDLSSGGFGLPGAEGWRVGAFFISKKSLPLPELNCFKGVHADPGYCAGFTNPSLLEVVYMARPNDTNWRPENFAQTAQQVFLRHLQDAVP